MWEVLQLAVSCSGISRITPTYVGSTIISKFRFNCLKDHPHVCGKYPTSLTSESVNQGSPPRMWEVRDVVVGFVNFLRITPTYVGSTGDVRGDIVESRDHPHVCGKYSISRA